MISQLTTPELIHHCDRAQHELNTYISQQSQSLAPETVPTIFLFQLQHGDLIKYSDDDPVLKRVISHPVITPSGNCNFRTASPSGSTYSFSASAECTVILVKRGVEVPE